MSILFIESFIKNYKFASRGSSICTANTHPLSFDPQHLSMGKTEETSIKVKKRDPSSRTARLAIDVVCTIYDNITIYSSLI